MNNLIDVIVSTHLANASLTYLHDIVDSGIHNLTNDYQGDDYDAFAAEFNRQAAILISIAEAEIIINYMADCADEFY